MRRGFLGSSGLGLGRGHRVGGRAGAAGALPHTHLPPGAFAPSPTAPGLSLRAQVPFSAELTVRTSQTKVKAQGSCVAVPGVAGKTKGAQSPRLSAFSMVHVFLSPCPGALCQEQPREGSWWVDPKSGEWSLVWWFQTSGSQCPGRSLAAGMRVAVMRCR